MAEKPPSLRMVGPADYVLRAGRVGVLKREHQRRLSALTRLARSIGAAQHGHGSCIRPVGRKLALISPSRSVVWRMMVSSEDHHGAKQCDGHGPRPS